MLIIIDRDGVINHDSPDYIKSPKEWIPISHSLDAITRLNHAGHQVVVATNQSGVGRGYYSLDMLEKIHQRMKDELASIGGHLDGIYFCPHTPEDNCDCRKPKPGLLLQIAKDFSTDLTTAYFIGDSLRDLQAAEAAGCLPVLVKTGNENKALAGIPIYNDLAQVAEAIISGRLT